MSVGTPDLHYLGMIFDYRINRALRDCLELALESTQV